MNSYLLLVLLPHLDSFLGVAGALGLVSSLIGGIMSFASYMNAYDDEDKKESMKFFGWAKRIFCGAFLAIFLTIFIPNKTELLQMKAIEVLSEVKGLDAIPQKVVDRLNSLLDLVEKPND